MARRATSWENSAECQVCATVIRMDLYVEMRHLRYVIAVAEELHFTRAAERLHLAAPSLSKQIKQLEAVLGYLLFERGTREVVLTLAGAAFVTEARQALVHAERAVECGAAASRGDIGAPSVGCTPWLDPSVLTAIRTAFTKEVPDTQVTFHSSYTVNQVDLLLKGSLHAGIILLPINANGLRTHCIWREALSVALPESHRFASQEEITFRDLLEEPMIWIARAMHPVLYDHVLKCCQKLGFVPNIVHEVVTVTEALDSVAGRVGLPSRRIRWDRRAGVPATA
jgi:DNA-binding transcriptional LysR family regulator